MKKRVFVAIDLSQEVKNKVNNYLKILRSEFSNLRVGWEKTEKLHLTLKFLGDLGDIQLEHLKKAFAKTADQVEKFTIQISGTGQFGKRVLWLGIKEKSRNLLKLHELLENETSKFGFERESKRFNPHLTIARLREAHKSSQIIKKHLQNKFEPLEFEVREIFAFQSELQPTGSIYSKLFVKSLKSN